jgi:hypothetical protein
VFSGKFKTTLSKRKGDFAGYLKQGYWIVKFQNKPYFAHRVIWLLFNDDLYDTDLYEVDHFNRNTEDNEVSNLRKVNHKVNCQNRGLRTDSPTSVVGVNPTKCKTGFRSRWCLNGKQYEKEFYGCDSFAKAVNHRIQMLEHLNSLGESYT